LGALRPQALLSYLGRLFYRGFDPVRRRPIAAADGDLPPAAGDGGRGDDPVLTGHSDGDLSARRAATRDGGVGDGADGRTDPRSDAGRLDHRQLELALEFLHQFADRNDRDPDGLDLRA